MHSGDISPISLSWERKCWLQKLDLAQGCQVDGDLVPMEERFLLE